MQCRAEQSRAEQSRAEQSRAEQSRAEQMGKIEMLDAVGWVGGAIVGPPMRYKCSQRANYIKRSHTPASHKAGTRQKINLGRDGCRVDKGKREHINIHSYIRTYIHQTHIHTYIHTYTKHTYIEHSDDLTNC